MCFGFNVKNCFMNFGYLNNHNTKLPITVTNKAATTTRINALIPNRSAYSMLF